MTRNKKKPSTVRFLLRLFGVDSSALVALAGAVGAFAIVVSLYLPSTLVSWVVAIFGGLVILGAVVFAKLRPPKRKRSITGIGFGSLLSLGGSDDSSASKRRDDLTPDPTPEPETYGPITNLPNSFN